MSVWMYVYKIYFKMQQDFSLILVLGGFKSQESWKVNNFNTGHMGCYVGDNKTAKSKPVQLHTGKALIN